MDHLAGSLQMDVQARFCVCIWMAEGRPRKTTTGTHTFVIQTQPQLRTNQATNHNTHSTHHAPINTTQNTHTHQRNKSLTPPTITHLPTRHKPNNTGVPRAQSVQGGRAHALRAGAAPLERPAGLGGPQGALFSLFCHTIFSCVIPSL